MQILKTVKRHERPYTLWDVADNPNIDWNYAVLCEDHGEVAFANNEFTAHKILADARFCQFCVGESKKIEKKDSCL